MPGERAPRSGEDERNAELIRNKLQNISDEEINKAIDELVAAGALHILKAVGDVVSAFDKGVEGVVLVFAVLEAEIGKTTTNHHVKAALRHMQAD